MRGFFVSVPNVTTGRNRENLTCLPLSTSTRSACGPPLASSRAQAGRSPDGSSGGSSPISERKGEREVASARFCTCHSECRALRGCCEGEARGDIYRVRHGDAKTVPRNGQLTCVAAKASGARTQGFSFTGRRVAAPRFPRQLHESWGSDAAWQHASEFAHVTVQSRLR